MLEIKALGIMLMRSDDEIGTGLMRSLIPQDFYDPYYRNLFQTMLDVAAKGLPVDFGTVVAEASGKRWFEDLNGSVMLANLFAEQVHFFPAADLVPSLRKFTLLRMQKGFGLLHENPEENILALERARDEYLGLLPTNAKKATDFKSVLLEADVVGMTSGFNGIDAMTNGMTPGQFIVVGARTGVGKSIYLMNVAAHVAMKSKKVLWIALEMSEREVLKRFCKLLDDEGHPDAIDYLETMDIISGSKTAAQIESEAMRGRYDMIVLDYLQLVRPERRWDSDVQRLEDLTRRMKQLAMGCNTILLSAAQLNRESEQHARPPRISDLRGSGSIEQDADCVILIHRIKRTDEAGQSRKKNLGVELAAAELEGRGDTTIYLEKNRAGREGVVSMTFDANRLRFVDPSILPAWFAGDPRLL